MLKYFKAIFKLFQFTILKKYFWTFKSFSSKPSNLVFDNLDRYEDYVIIIQGPLAKTFTIETIKYYKKIFPGIIIVFSTWKLSNKDLNKLQLLDIEVIENIPPAFRGFSNINLQIITTSNGIKYSERFNRKYILKTRSDQRFYNSKSLLYMTDLLNHFSSISDVKLVGCSLDNILSRSFFLSDHLMFGKYSDMLNYWSPDLDLRVFTNHNKITDSNQHFYKIGGSYFFVNYIENHLNLSLDGNFEEILAKNFVIINKSEINIYWDKYNLREDKYSDGYSSNERTFLEWFNLHIKYYEK